MSRPTLNYLSRLAESPAPHSPLPFLAPTLESLSPRSAPNFRYFSSSTYSAAPQQRRNRDKSRKRGVSVIHRTGPRWPLSMQKYPLPVPVANPEARKKFETSKDHGLWAFFNEKRESMELPEEHSSHGRAWTYRELSYKSWDDLHRLYWICAKERNRIATSEYERNRVHAGFGEHEATERDNTIKETQKQIKNVLRDRWTAWHEARDLWNSGVRPGEDQFVEDEYEELEKDPALDEQRAATEQNLQERQSHHTTSQGSHPTIPLTPEPSRPTVQP